MPKTNPLKLRTFKGNPKLKAIGVQLPFTKEQILERQKCSEDPLYFIENYMKIVNVDEGLINFELWDFQKELIMAIHENRWVIGKLPRQVGKSTCVCAYLLWVILFQRDQTLGILANKASTAIEILGKARKAYEHLPFWMQQGVATWNKTLIELENGSRIIAGATSGDSVRGYTYNMVLLDEFAFVPYQLADEFITSTLPTISSGRTTKMIMISTPKGMNMFYKYWTDAVEGRNRYKPISVHWSDVPGRDQEWYDEQVANMGAERVRQEVDCEFLGSADTLISATKLKEMAWKTPILENHGIRVYETARDDRFYVATVHKSQGQGKD